jgi:hypothetical protein
MPVHDWTRVDAGVFHDFHNVWIGELRNALNKGLLPEGFYAMCEQHGGKRIADVLTLVAPSEAPSPSAPITGGIAVAEAPPKVRHHVSLASALRTRRKTLTIRHVTGDRLIAVVEVVSPANKDRNEHVEELLDKLEEMVTHGIHVLLVDLFAPGKYDPSGLHVALLQRLDDETDAPPPQEPLTLASYVADFSVTAYWEHLAFGGVLPDMPLFLDPDIYINVPLEATYLETWRGTPARWREVLERPNGKAPRKRRR